MPLYLYKCPQCHDEQEELRKVEDRHKELRCSNCGTILNLAIQLARPILFEPQVFEHLDTSPVYVESKKQLKEECNRRGVWAKCLD